MICNLYRCIPHILPVLHEWQGFRIFCIFLFRIVEFFTKTLLCFFPSIVKDGFSFCGKLFAIANCNNAGFLIAMFFAGGADQAHGNLFQNITFRGRQMGKVCLGNFSGRNKGMVVADLLIIDAAFYIDVLI